ncbi:MAG: Holliday junction resolvase RuvX [Holosporaceae bacterium]|nr:Holliday junction resolvase RuvX [Holosporaceae bacterium]
MDFFLKNLCDLRIEEFTDNKKVLIGLDIGDKTIGLAVSDKRNRIASSVATIIRKNDTTDYETLLRHIKHYDVGLAVFGWPIQMNGKAGPQCEKVSAFVGGFSGHTNGVLFAPWDERFSTSVVEHVMIEADMSRGKRSRLLDKTAAIYILQGAIDFLNRPRS